VSRGLQSPLCSSPTDGRLELRPPKARSDVVLAGRKADKICDLYRNAFSNTIIYNKGACINIAASGHKNLFNLDNNAQVGSLNLGNGSFLKPQERTSQ
jgi:hypothetical protein